MDTTNNSRTHQRRGGNSTAQASRLFLVLVAGVMFACVNFYNFHASDASVTDDYKLHYHQELRRELEDLQTKYLDTVQEKEKLGNDMDSLQKEYVSLLDTMEQYKAQHKEQHQKEEPPMEKNDRDEELQKSTSNPPNILLLYGDDWRYDSFHAAGNKVIQTPVFDKLAKEGIMFTHNCVTTSICGISRATLQTGQYFSRHKCNPHKRNDHSKPLFLEYWNETLNGLVRSAGYHVGFVGKWQIRGLPFDKFDYVKDYSGFHVDHEGNHITKLNERHALDFLQQRPRDKPFFLTVSFFATHAVDGDPLQYIPQNKSMSLYRNTTISIAPSATKEAWQRLPDFFVDQNEARSRWRQRYGTPEMYQHHMKNMYRMVTEVDTTSGKLLRQLKRQGVLNNTIVIFTTDNGNLHSEHGLAEKWYPYQESIRVPLVIKDPRMPAHKRGTTSDELTLSVDLAPTIVSAAGVKPPERMQGRDIAELYLEDSDKKHKTWRKLFYYEHPEIDCALCITGSEALVLKDSNKYAKYFRWTGHDTEQLFDLHADPYEENDLAQNEEHQVELQAMKELFEATKQRAQ